MPSVEHQHSDHKLVVWGAVGKLKPARKKRPDQFRWKLGDLLDNKERRAAYEQCCAAECEALAYQAPSMTPTAVEVAFRGLLTKVAQEQLGDQVRVPGEGRVKAHTWRVTKLYKVKRQAGLHLKRARTYGTHRLWLLAHSPTSRPVPISRRSKMQRSGKCSRRAWMRRLQKASQS